MTEYDIQNIDKQINEILNGTKDISRFNQSEHAGVCSAGPLLIGALLVCDIVRESFKTSPNAGESQTTPANWEIDEKQEQSIMQTDYFVSSYPSHILNVCDLPQKTK